MDFALSPELQRLRARFRAFAREEVLPLDTTPESFKAALLIDKGDFARKEVSMAKVHVADTLHLCADTAVQLCGARGYSKDTPAEWIYRFARQARLVDGATEVHQQVPARHFMEERGDFWRWA